MFEDLNLANLNLESNHSKSQIANDQISTNRTASLQSVSNLIYKPV